VFLPGKPSQHYKIDFAAEIYKKSFIHKIAAE
jgi:hypothetical protein